MAHKTKAQYEAEKKAREEKKKADAERKVQEDLKARTRKPADIQKIYDSLITQLGDKEFRIKVLEAEALQLGQQLFELSKEYKIAEKVHGVPPKADDAQNTIGIQKPQPEVTQ